MTISGDWWTMLIEGKSFVIAVVSIVLTQQGRNIYIVTNTFFGINDLIKVGSDFLMCFESRSFSKRAALSV